VQNTSSENNSPENRKNIATEIRGKWGKFSDSELAALKSRDDLVSQLQAKYSRDKARAERDVDALLKGRTF
jgi:hypothetical protein